MVGDETPAHPERAPIVCLVPQCLEPSDFLTAQLPHAIAEYVTPLFQPPQDLKELKMIHAVHAGDAEVPTHGPLLAAEFTGRPIPHTDLAFHGICPPT
jgi:hypothetical protein